MYEQSVSLIHDPSEVVNSLVHRVCPHKEHIGPTDKNLFRFMYVLSLVEILISFMVWIYYLFNFFPSNLVFRHLRFVFLTIMSICTPSWDWTNDNFICQFCELLELRLMDDSSAAIIVLLSQLGRLGVVASGYEGTGIKELRERLSALTRQINFSKLNLVTQLALMNALLGLSPIKFEEIVNSKGETPLDLSKSIDSEFVKKCFSLLSNETQSFFKIQQADSKTTCNYRFLS